MSDIQQPMAVVSRAAGQITVLGTAHVSRVSADKVKELIQSGLYDAVAIELCTQRHHALVNPDALAKMDLFKVIREGKAAMVAATLALSAFQQRIADQMGIKPGAELHAAIHYAAERHLPVILIDRDIGTTLRRVYRNVPFWHRVHLLAGLLASVLSRQQVTESEIEKLKQGDILASAFARFEQERKYIYTPLVAERDHYMAARLENEFQSRSYKHILAVVGAGHLQGIDAHLRQGVVNPAGAIALLDTLPKASAWGIIIPWILVLTILIGFVIGFQKNPDLGWQLIVDWVVISGGLSAFGALLAGAHPVTLAATFCAAPITILNPFIGVGMVSAPVEVWMRKPKVGDFDSLREDAKSVRGWWNNRVTRTLLVFILSSIGASIGAFVAGYQIYEKISL